MTNLMHVVPEWLERLEPKLQPCPFCGGSQFVVFVRGYWEVSADPHWRREISMETQGRAVDGDPAYEDVQGIECRKCRRDILALARDGDVRAREYVRRSWIEPEANGNCFLGFERKHGRGKAKEATTTVRIRKASGQPIPPGFQEVGPGAYLRITVRCDGHGCGKGIVVSAVDIAEARAEAAKEGWTFDGRSDRCPTCSARRC